MNKEDSIKKFTNFLLRRPTYDFGGQYFRKGEIINVITQELDQLLADFEKGLREDLRHELLTMLEDMKHAHIAAENGENGCDQCQYTGWEALEDVIKEIRKL